MALTQIGSDGVKDDAVTLAKQAAGTDGQIITYDASGNPVAVGPGTDGQVLTSTGAGSPPAFEAIPAAGAALTGSTNNTITTVTGANAIQGEANLTFDGKTLTSASSSYPETTELIREIKGGVANANRFTNRYIKINQTFTGSAQGSLPIVWEANADGSNNKSYGAITTESDGSISFLNKAAGSAVSVGTGLGLSERLRIDSSGKVLLNTTDVPSQGADTFTVKASDGGNAGITIRTGTGNTGNIFFSDGTSGSGEYAGYIYYAHGTDKLHFGMDAADRLVIGSGGDIEVKTGNVVIGTAGKGIDFSAQTASSSGTTGAELLDHYEEGSFSPTAAEGTFTTSNATYTRIGRSVTYQIYGSFSSNSSGNAQSLTNFPFAAIAGTYYSAAVNSNTGSGAHPVGQFGANTGLLVFKDTSNNAFNGGDMSSHFVVISGVYETT